MQEQAQSAMLLVQYKPGANMPSSQLNRHETLLAAPLV